MLSKSITQLCSKWGSLGTNLHRFRFLSSLSRVSCVEAAARTEQSNKERHQGPLERLRTLGTYLWLLRQGSTWVFCRCGFLQLWAHVCPSTSCVASCGLWFIGTSPAVGRVAKSWCPSHGNKSCRCLWTSFLALAGRFPSRCTSVWSRSDSLKACGWHLIAFCIETLLPWRPF